jgi:hypothetical protein
MLRSDEMNDARKIYEGCARRKGNDFLPGGIAVIVHGRNHKHHELFVEHAGYSPISRCHRRCRRLPMVHWRLSVLQ